MKRGFKVAFSLILQHTTIIKKFNSIETMTLFNIAKHLVFLTEKSFPHETSQTSANEISAAEQLFELLKSFKDSHFSELDSYETLDFPDEYDEIFEDENSADEENLDKSEDDDDESDDEN